MKLNSPLIAFALIGLVSPAVCQTRVHANSVTEIPSMAPSDGKADHATVAINDGGDIFVTWSSSLVGPTNTFSGKRRVEGAFFRRVSATKWDRYPSVVLGETNPAALPGGHSVFPLGDTCQKPDVIAAGGDFVVAWPRQEDSNGSSKCQLEFAYIKVPSSGNADYNLSSSAGLGFLIEDTLDPRASDCMVDLAFSDKGKGDPVFIATYASFKASTPLGSEGGIAYDFDVRGIVVKIKKNGDQFSVLPLQTLAEDIPFDDFATPESSGGRILPDVVIDEFGHLVLAFESFERGRRANGSAPDVGQIHVRRYKIHKSGNLEEKNRQVVSHQSFEFAQRRPNLMRTEGNTQISMAWGVRHLPNTTTDVAHYSIDYPTDRSDAVIADYGHVMAPGLNESYPIPIQFEDQRSVMISFDGVNNSEKYIAHQRPGNTSWTIAHEFSKAATWRPAIAVLEDDPLNSNGAVIPLTVEDRGGASKRLRIFIEILAF